MSNINYNQIVFTTKFVIKDLSPVLNVSHYYDGAWQFSGKEKSDNKDIMLVTLKQISELHPDIKDILSLEIGHCANRENINSQWVITKQ